MESLHETLDAVLDSAINGQLKQARRQAEHIDAATFITYCLTEGVDAVETLRYVSRIYANSTPAKD